MANSQDGFSTSQFLTALGVAATTLAVVPAQAESARDEALSLDEIKVGGFVEDEYKAEPTSKKYTAPLRETPKSVTVVTDQVIRDTGALSLTEALRTVSGITMGAGEGGNPAGDRPIIRGFNAESDTFLDGMRDIGMQTRDVFNLEQIEVSKGPGSAYTGAGSTGGSLNLVSKTAKSGNFVDISQTFGSDQTRRTTLDGNYQISDQVAGRLNLMKHDAHVAGRDGVSVSRWGVAPTITFGLNSPTRATLSYYHLSTDDMPDYGIPLTTTAFANANNGGIREPIDVDEDNFYGLAARDFRTSTTDAGTFVFEHDLNDELTLSNSTRVARTTLDYIVTNPDDSRNNVDDGLVYRSSKSRNSTAKGWVNQTDLKVSFDTGFIGHTLVTGVEFSHQDVHNRPYVVTPGGGAGNACTPALVASGDCTSLHSPNPKDFWTGSITDSAAYTDTNTKTASAYVFDTLKLHEQWSLNLGLRYDDYETRSSGYSTGGRGQPAGDFDYQSNTHFWNYQVGLVYNPLPNGSIYVAWSTSSNPSGEAGGEGQDALSAATQPLEPERNRNVELGTKWDFFDDRLAFTAAVFRTEKSNARVADGDGTTRNIGETRVDGFELGASGTLTDNWNVFANYTYLDSEIVRAGGDGANDGNDVPNAAQNSFSLWSTYELSPKLTLGAGANYVDARFGNPANTVQVPDYWRYDAMAKYVVNDNLNLQLNLQNLTDERYYDQVFSTHYAHVAPGRTALLSTNLSF
jgi:catecholate siderophore receptor